jgi:UDP-N-acetylglucosamine transferase subunit ALG13
MEKQAGSFPGQPSSLPFPPSPVCDLLILLSGPEPQRTILEREIRQQLPALPGKTILVRGLPQTRVKDLREENLQGKNSQEENYRENDPAEKDTDEEESKKERSSGLKIYDHLPAAALNEVMLDAKLVIARAGYSTIMDLIALGKKSILIPTPGQTEQEYLGDHLARRRIALCIPQSEFSLSRALEAAGNFPFAEATNPEEEKLLKNEIRALCLELNKITKSASSE